MEKTAAVLTVGFSVIFVALTVALLLTVALNVSGLFCAPQFVFDFLGLTLFKVLLAGIVILPCSLFLAEMGE